MRGGGRIGFPVLAVSLITITITLAFAPIALHFSLSPRNLLRMEGAMTLLVQFAITVEAAGGVRRLYVDHVVTRPQASVSVCFGGHQHRRFSNRDGNNA